MRQGRREGVNFSNFSDTEYRTPPTPIPHPHWPTMMKKNNNQEDKQQSRRKTTIRFFCFSPWLWFPDSQFGAYPWMSGILNPVSRDPGISRDKSCHLKLKIFIVLFVSFWCATNVWRNWDVLIVLFIDFVLISYDTNKFWIAKIIRKFPKSFLNGAFDAVNPLFRTLRVHKMGDDTPSDPEGGRPPQANT